MSKYQEFDKMLIANKKFRQIYFLDIIKSLLDFIPMVRTKPDKIKLITEMFDKLIGSEAGLLFVNEYDNFKLTIHNKLLGLIFESKEYPHFFINIKKYFKAIFGIDFILDYVTLNSLDIDCEKIGCSRDPLVHNKLIEAYYESDKDKIKDKIKEYFKYVYDADIESVLIKKVPQQA